MKYTEAQQQIVDRYLDATKDNPESRLPLSVIVGIKKHIPKYRPDRVMLEKCEEQYLQQEPIVAPGRKQRQIDNKAVSDVLSKYKSLKQAVRQFYWIDDIITGVSRIDLGGNTRPLSISLLFHFISTSTVINTSIIMSYCDVKTRQAQKIMTSLSIANRMIVKELKRMTLI